MTIYVYSTSLKGVSEISDNHIAAGDPVSKVCFRTCTVCLTPLECINALSTNLMPRIAFAEQHEGVAPNFNVDFGGEGGIDSSLRSSPLRGACGVLRRAVRGLSNRKVLFKPPSPPHKKSPLRGFPYVAEREGFEPSEPARVHLISSQARSASSGTSPGSVFNLVYQWELAQARWRPKARRYCTLCFTG